MSVQINTPFWVKLDLGSTITGKAPVLQYRVITPFSGAVSTAFGGFTEPYAGFYMAQVTLAVLGEHSLLVYSSDGTIARSSVSVTVSSQSLNTLATDTDMQFLRAIAAGGWDMVNNQMLFYAEDNTTLVKKYNLFNSGGVPAMTGVTKRLTV